MDSLTQQQQLRVTAEQFTFEPHSQFGIGEVRAKATFDKSILAADFPLVLAGLATGQQHEQQVHVAGPRRRVIVVNPPRTARDHAALRSFERLGSASVVEPPKPASGSVVECFMVSLHGILPPAPNRDRERRRWGRPTPVDRRWSADRRAIMALIPRRPRCGRRAEGRRRGRQFRLAPAEVRDCRVAASLGRYGSWGRTPQ